jgi:uncharacterized linocin/CFP29 family protein
MLRNGLLSGVAAMCFAPEGLGGGGGAGGPPIITSAGPTQMDFIGVNSRTGLIEGSTGNVAGTLLRHGFNVNSLRRNDYTGGVLKKDEWVLFDREVIETARRRLTLVQDMLGRGLRFPIQNPLGVTRIEWHTVSHIEGAFVDMSPSTPGREDRVEFALQAIPLPIIHKEFRLNIRYLEASRRGGTPIDTMEITQATRLVSETIEQMVLTGWPQLYGGMSIYGLTTAPYRNTGSLGGQWTNSAYTGAQIIADLQAMISALQADFFYGPYVVYIPLNYDNKLNEDYKANSDLTIRQRILEMPQIEDIRASEFLAANTVLMFQPTKEVLDLVDGFGPTLVQWDGAGGFEFFFKVIAMMIPRMKWNKSLNSGVAHFSG